MTEWRKASGSYSTDQCVEVAVTIDGVKVRDSKHGDASPVLFFTYSEWVMFLRGAKTGEFDLEPSYELNPAETWISPQT
ncbi:DUF397 domain-containing protein [Sphaerisporangium sp. NPDC088356]|uniref:DUF397 domain-containing protein n=1 Tax=Sphaerisporangium sp. NPDC088356 TaxID=3154871 RepID=UPI003413EAC5